VAPLHDALMVEGPADAIDDVVARTQEAMAEASEIVLAGFRLRSDVKIVRWPDRYMDERGREFWGRVMALLPAGRELNREAIRVTSSWVRQETPDPPMSPCPD
jgi:DNA polymerase I